MNDLKSQQPFKILHVDDETVQLDDFRSFIDKHAPGEFEVTSFTSAELALSKLAEDESFDLCLVDLQLVSNRRHAFRSDVWGGLQFATTAKILVPSTSFVVLSSMTPTKSVRKSAAQAGCFGFLQKLHLNESKYRAVLDQLNSASLYSRCFTRMRSDARLSFSESMAHSFKRELDRQIDILQNLKMNLQTEEAQREATLLVSKLLSAQDNMKDTLSHALKFYTRNTIEPAEVNIVGLLESLVDEIEVIGDVRILPPQLENCLVECDARLLRIAVTNLIQNALDATDWRANKRQIDIRLLSALSVNDVEYMVIEVQDNGLGLESGTEQLILQPMYSGENVNKGRLRFGIGCAEADRIARLHHNRHMSGSLSVENRNGVRGCVSRLIIPRFVDF